MFQQQQQPTLHPGLIRSENPYHSKRRYHSGRHSPPLPVYPHPHRPSRGGRRVNGVLLPVSDGFRTVFIAPDRYLSRSHLVQVTATPPQLVSGSEWDMVASAVPF